MIYLRNLKTGEIRKVDAFSPEHAEIRFERYEDVNGKPRFVWEQTSAADADPETYAHPDEVHSRRQHGLEDLSMVTADGSPTSEAAAKALAEVDPGSKPVQSVARDDDDVAGGGTSARARSQKASGAKSHSGE